MKSQVTLLLAIVQMYGRELCIETARDRMTIRERHNNQGSYFLEVSLPLLDDSLTQGLAHGVLQPTTGYSLQTKTRLPRFLNGFWARIFAPDGTILETPCPDTIRAIRQISRTFKKVFEVCNESAVEAAYGTFRVTDSALSTVRLPRYVETLREIAQQAFSSAVGAVFEEDLTFKHGPGAVADKQDSIERYEFPVVSDVLLSEVGMDVFKPFWWQKQPESGEIPARIIAVPKTATKPRLISIEPAYNQFVQQGIHTVLKRELGKNRICGYLSQEPNQLLAREGSLSGHLATIDLSEASDRVHMGLFRAMFGFNKPFVRLVESCRSRSVEFPDGSLLVLNKFASMGSALTFPIESMYFTVMVIYSICEASGDFSRKKISSILRDPSIRVYGDDIIIPVDYAHILIRNLEEVGLKVNSEKSFLSGHFRESCGGDFFEGHNVTPIYSRRRIPTSRREVSEIVSLVSFRNQIWQRHAQCEVTELLDKWIETLLPGIPSGNSEVSGDLVLDSFDQKAEQVRYNDRLQRVERKGWIIRDTRRPTTASDEAVLFKALCSVDSKPLNLLKVDSEDYESLTHHGRPTSSFLKRGWAPVL